MKIGGFGNNNPFFKPNPNNNNNNKNKLGNLTINKNMLPNKDLLNDINNMLYRKTKQEENNSPLSSIDPMLKYLEEKSKTDRIAKKIAEGKRVTQEEMEYLASHDIEKLNNAKLAHDQKKRVESAMKSAKTKQQAMSIYNQALSSCANIAKTAPDMAELVMKAIQSIKVDKVLNGKQNSDLEDIQDQVKDMINPAVGKKKSKSSKFEPNNIDLSTFDIKG